MRQLVAIFAILLIMGSCGNRRDNVVQSEVQTEAKQDTMLQRKILGIELGKTTKDSALSLMKQLGYDMYQVDRDVFYYDNDIRFGDQTWDAMFFVTYDDRVCIIQFLQNTKIRGLQSAFDNYDELALILKDKYKPLIVSEDTAARKMGISFADGLTTLDLYFGTPDGLLLLNLSYRDSVLANKYEQMPYNEL